MGRQLRIEFAGAVYHVMSRGNARQTIFSDDQDRRRFLELLGEVCDLFSWRVYSYCLMDNHFHLVIETEAPTLSRGVQSLKARYSRYANRRHGRDGHLFGDRFKALLVDRDTYLARLLRYVARNPVEAGLVARADDWPWSAHNAICGAGPTPVWLDRNVALEAVGGPAAKAVRAYRALVDGPDAGDDAEPWHPEADAVDRILGSAKFVDEITDAFREPVETETPQRRDARLREIIASCSEPAEAMTKAYLDGGYRLREIAAHFGVHISTVNKAIHRHRNRAADS